MDLPELTTKIALVDVQDCDYDNINFIKIASFYHFDHIFYSPEIDLMESNLSKNKYEEIL